MSQLRNPSNKIHVDALVVLKGKTKDPMRRANIDACLNKALETPDAITRDQVIWAIDGKSAFIGDRKEQIFKLHKDHKKDLDKAFVLSLSMGSQMMTNQGNNSSSSKPQPPLHGTALGCITSKDARPIPSETPLAELATTGRAQSTATTGRAQSSATTGRAQSTAMAGSGQKSVTTARATQTKPTFEIPFPTDDEKNAVALFTNKWRNHPYGMHIIWAKIRMSTIYGVGQKEVNIDIFYDTGSTAQGVPAPIIEAMIGKNTAVGWMEDFMSLADGTTKVVQTGKFEIKLFMDRQRTKPLQDWFEVYGNVNAGFALCGGEMRFATGLHFANLPGVNSPLIVGKSMPAVIYQMFKFQ